MAGLSSVMFWPTRTKGEGTCLAVEVAGVLAAAAPLGMPSGKIEHHPNLHGPAEMLRLRQSALSDRLKI